MSSFEVQAAEGGCDNLMECHSLMSLNEPLIIENHDALGLLDYNPTVEAEIGCGSSAVVGRLKPGVVLKYPRFSWWIPSTTKALASVEDIKNSFFVEEQILRILGDHPRIVKFLGASDEPRGLLFEEANCGNMQTYIDSYNETMTSAVRLRWRTQAAQAIQYIHEKGVIHSDLRPENYLVHSDANGVLNICLCDFGGSTCGDLDGGHLPDSGFFNPHQSWESTSATDIFSLGSVFFTIMTGHWPHRSSGLSESLQTYRAKVDELFSKRQFPTTKHLIGGAIIQRCWTEEYDDAGQIVHDQEVLAMETCL